MPASAERGRSQTDVQRIVDRCCNPHDNDKDGDDNDEDGDTPGLGMLHCPQTESCEGLKLATPPCIKFSHIPVRC